MLGEPQAIDPRTIWDAILPLDEKTRLALFEEKIILTRIQDTYMVYDPQAPSVFPFYIPLQHARLVEGAYGCKYPTLLDNRSLPTAEERAHFPAMFSDTVMSCRMHLNPNEVAEHLYRIFDALPTPSQVLAEALRQLHEVQVAAYLHHDKRFYSPVEQVVTIIKQEGTLPTTIEAVKERIPEKERDPYYSLCHHLREAKILLHWYNNVKTLYVVKMVGYEGSSTGDRFIVVGSDKHRGLVEFAATFAWNVASDTSTEGWELYENDHLLYRADREKYEPNNIYELSAEWIDRSDDLILNWIV